MHQTKKGNQYFFGMKSHIGIDAESGLVHSVVGTAANVADGTEVDQSLHGKETYVSGDAGYTGVEKRPEHQHRHMISSIAARPSSYKKHAKNSLIGRMRREIEYAKAQVRAKVEHPFRVIKRQFGYTKFRFRGLVKNTAQHTTLHALSNLWMMRKRLLNAGDVRL
jgi:IS5 family transposase